MNPYKYKFDILEHAKDPLNKNINLLLQYLLQGGLFLLQKKVVTYRSKNIIELFIICHYLLHLLIEYTIKFSQEFHDIASFVHGEISNNGLNDSESCVPETVHELFRLLENNNGKPEYAIEAEAYMSMKDNIALNDIDESYKRKWDQLQKIYIKIFKVGISKIVSKANALFFKKYYGRIPHLYRQYASRTIVVENTMAGDPGEILTTSGVKYIERLAKDSTELFNGLLQLARRITSMTNIQEKINVINAYCKKFPIDKEEPDKIKFDILNETRYRIAGSILQDNEIYGFTIDGILQNKKFPPANHIVTSLFVRNPHEKPREQSVSEIFSGEEHILQFAHPENIAKFNNLYRQSSYKIIETFNPKISSMTEKNLNKASHRFMEQIKRYEMPSDSNSMTQIDPKSKSK
jgi:hypothetical protein